MNGAALCPCRSQFYTHIEETLLTCAKEYGLITFGVALRKLEGRGRDLAEEIFGAAGKGSVPAGRNLPGSN